jgi:hypothetical protein
VLFRRVSHSWKVGAHVKHRYHASRGGHTLSSPRQVWPPHIPLPPHILGERCSAGETARYRDEPVPELLPDVPDCPEPVVVPVLPVVPEPPEPLMVPLPDPVPLVVPEPLGSLVVPLLDPVLLLPAPPVVPERLGSLMVPLLDPVPLVPVPPVVPGPVTPLPELPVPPAPPVCARANVTVMQSTAKVRISIFAEVRYIPWLLCVCVGSWNGAQAHYVPGTPCAICNGLGPVVLSNSLPQRQGAAITRIRARTPESRPRRDATHRSRRRMAEEEVQVASQSKRSFLCVRAFTAPFFSRNSLSLSIVLYGLPFRTFQRLTVVYSQSEYKRPVVLRGQVIV